MAESPNPIAEIVTHVNGVYDHVLEDPENITREQLKSDLDDVARVIAEHFGFVPRDDRAHLARFILLKLCKIARSLTYVRRRTLLPIVYEKSKEIHRTVDGDVDALSVIESLAKVADKEQTFRDILMFKESIERYERIRRNEP